MSETLSPREQLEKVHGLIKDVRIAMLTTMGPDGTPHARPMAAHSGDFETDPGTLWFFTSPQSAKVHEVDADSLVSVTFADPSHQNYVAAVGRARLVTDRAKIRELWNPSLRTWFPRGADDPSVALLKVTVESAEYWDSPSSTLLHLYGTIKATLTGESPKFGPESHGKVELAR